MTAEAEDTKEADYNLLGVSSGWVDALTEHGHAVHWMRLSYARSTKDALEVPHGSDDWGLRMMAAPDDTGQRELEFFEVSGIGQFPGPRRLAEWLWEEATDHWRGLRTMAEANDEPPPRRMRAVLSLLGKGRDIIDEPGCYVGIRSKSGAERRASARGVKFREDTDPESGEELVSASPSRINRELERGYVAMVKLSNKTATDHAESVTRFAKATMEQAERYREHVGSEDDGSDDVALGFLELGKELIGQGRERKDLKDDAASRAPNDGGPGGPGCALAREALNHFTEDVLARCADLLGGGWSQALAALRWAEETSVDEKKFLKRFKQTAQWFHAIAQKDPTSLRAIPVPARQPLQDLAVMALGS